MATTTVTVRKYDYKTMALVKSGSFSYTASKATISLGVRGITWDGSHLVFATSNSLGATASAPFLLFVDPTAFTLVKAVQTGLSSSRSIRDIAWCGSPEENDGREAGGFFYVLDDIAGTIELNVCDPKGGLLQAILSTTMPTYSRGLACSGAQVWCTSSNAAPGACYLHTYDGKTGIPIRAALPLSSAGMQGGGIIFDGARILEKIDPALNFTRLYWLYDISSAGAAPMKYISTVADNATEQGPIAFDGAFIYEFDSSV